jgi:hypothetical protein
VTAYSSCCRPTRTRRAVACSTVDLARSTGTRYTRHTAWRVPHHVLVHFASGYPPPDDVIQRHHPLIGPPRGSPVYRRYVPPTPPPAYHWGWPTTLRPSSPSPSECASVSLTPLISPPHSARRRAGAPGIACPTGPVPSGLKEGARCGGACNLLGDCAAGLRCVVPPPPPPLILGPPMRGPTPLPTQHQEGTCTQAPSGCAGCTDVEGGGDADGVGRC